MGRYLITGGAGFIGSHLVKALAGKAEWVRVFDNFTTGRRENLEGLPPNVEIIEGDIRDREAVNRVMKDARYVLHQAALASVPESIEDPVTYEAVNVGGTLNLLIAAAEEKVARFVFASSTAVYGEAAGQPISEEDRPAPLSPYAVSKRVGELYGFTWHGLHRLPFVALRYFNVFGDGQDENSPYAAVIPIFIARILNGEKPVIYGDGTQSRDFIYVSDVVRANLLALEREEAPGEIFNVAGGKGYDLNDLALTLARLIGAPEETIHAEARPGDIVHSLAAIEKARRLLRFEPEIGFEEGLRRTVAWYRTKTAGDPAGKIEGSAAG